MAPAVVWWVLGAPIGWAGGEDHAIVTQSPCQELGAPLGAAGSQCTPCLAQRLQLPLCSRQPWPRAPSQGRFSKNLAIKQEPPVMPGSARKAWARESPGHWQEPRRARVTLWARLGGRGRKHLSSHNHLIIG